MMATQSRAGALDWRAWLGRARQQLPWFISRPVGVVVRTFQFYSADNCSIYAAAIAYYAIARRRNLVTPMIAGDAPVTLPGVAGAAPARDDAPMRLRALALLAASAAAVWGLLEFAASAAPGF